MEHTPSPQHEEPLAGSSAETTVEGANAGSNGPAAGGEPFTGAAASELGMQAKCAEIMQLMAHVQALFPADCPGADARTVVNALTNEDAIDFAKVVAQVMRRCSELQVLSAGAVGTRSVKRAGRPGIAQASGFKTSVEMMQHLTGSSWGEMSRKIRVGESILTGETAEREAREQREALAKLARETNVNGDDVSGDGDGDLAGVAVKAAAAEALLVLGVPWHTVLDRAVSRDLLTDPQNDAIRQGLGQPPRASATGTPASDATTIGIADTEATSTPTAGATAVRAVADSAAIVPACAFHTAAYAALHTSRDEHSPATISNVEGTSSIAPTTASGCTATTSDTNAGFFADGDCGGRCEAALLVLWWQAGLDLIGAAQHTRVEELRRQARAIRDLLDPDGASLRRNERYEARSFRWWTDPKGQFHARLTCDDDAGAWIGAIFASALRPRRGGPRFIDPAEQAAGDELAQDTRTHEQISHDLLIDLLQSGAVADQQTVFGTRQVGVRVVQVVNRAAYLAEQAEARAAEAAAKAAKAAAAKAATPAKAAEAAKKTSRQAAGGETPETRQTADTQGAGTLGTGTQGTGTQGTGTQAPGTHEAVPAGVFPTNATPSSAAATADPVGVVAWYEDGLTITSDAVVARQRCNAGVVYVTVDEDYNPLDVGREQRLYNSQQRIALAVRDGGCRWPGCDRPSSYCEAHHIDHWHSDQGRTDIDRGIALCRAHHLQLHNYGWKITRDGRGPFILHPPPGAEGTAAPILLENPPPPGARASRAVVDPTKQPAATAETSAIEHTQRELATPLPITYGMRLGAPRARRFKPADQRAFATANGYT